MIFVLLNLNIIQINCDGNLSYSIIGTCYVNFDLFTNRLTTNVQEQVFNIKGRKFLDFDACGFDTGFENFFDCLGDLLRVLRLCDEVLEGGVAVARAAEQQLVCEQLEANHLEG